MSKRSQHAKNATAARKLRAKIAQQLKRGAGRGVEAAVRFLVARIKETLAVPAPKTAIRGKALPGKKLGPIVGYQVTARATRGAPPRKVSGRMQQGTTHKMLTPTIGLVGTHARGLPTKSSPEGFNYPEHHEVGDGDQLGDGDHPFLKPTVDKYRKEIRTLVGAAVRTELNRG